MVVGFSSSTTKRGQSELRDGGQQHVATSWRHRRPRQSARRLQQHHRPQLRYSGQCLQSGSKWEYNDVYPSVFNGMSDPAGSNGNISSSPLFNSTTDLTLQSSSPCINAGDPDPLLNDADGTRADMEPSEGRRHFRMTKLWAIALVGCLACGGNGGSGADAGDVDAQGDPDAAGPAAPLVINELMARNRFTIPAFQEGGIPPDWIEIYNPTNEDVALGGLLPHRRSDPAQEGSSRRGAQRSCRGPPGCLRRQRATARFSTPSHETCT